MKAILPNLAAVHAATEAARAIADAAAPAVDPPTPPRLLVDSKTLNRMAQICNFEETLAVAQFHAADPDDYFSLLPHLPGLAALWALEAVMDDITLPMAMITVALAKNYMLPALAEDHPLRGIAVELVDAYEEFAVNGGSATNYADVAWDFRYDYEAAGKLGYLYNALPSQGVDEEVGHGPNPARRWAAVGQYLMQCDPAGREIDALWDALIDADPDPEGTAEEADGEPDWWMVVCRDRSAARLEELMKPYDENVRATIFAILMGFLSK